MIEREKYANSITYALRNKETVMSIVMDDMDQSNCLLPSKGTQGSFTHPLLYKLQGVIIHGVGCGCTAPWTILRKIQIYHHMLYCAPLRLGLRKNPVIIRKKFLFR